MVGVPTEERLRRIASVTDLALANLDVSALLPELLDRVRELLETDTASVLLWDEASESLVPAADRGIEGELPPTFRVPFGQGFAGRVMAEAGPVLIDRIDDTTVLNPRLREAGLRALLGVPLWAEGRVMGVLHIGTMSARRFTEHDVEFLQLVADRVSLATQARLSKEERAAAAALQRSLLPFRLPYVPGLELAARYIPGEAGAVGGDWYDVLSLPGGRLGVVMGDVVGRGLRAAVVMGRLRSALRAYALETTDPAEVLTRLDRKLQHFEPGETATVLYGVFEPSFDRLTMSSAGHLPPLLASAGAGTDYVDVPIDPPLGVSVSVRRRHVEVGVERGAAVCLYTDGLVERRRAGIDEGLDRLRTAVEPGRAEDVCGAALGALVGEGEPIDDDVALLVVRRPADTAESQLDLVVDAQPSSVSHVRAVVRRWLVNRGVGPDDVSDVLVAVGEACSNAVEHAYGAGGGSVEVRLGLDGPDLVARVRDHGHWRDQRGCHRGRGMSVMSQLVDEVYVERGPTGTEVVIRRRLGTPDGSEP
jgi:serine phosphatase RsbU (regulator of sigma subunit)/anti-sigma regulatory factor (Ser/Thr protein kinase)